MVILFEETSYFVLQIFRAIKGACNKQRQFSKVLIRVASSGQVIRTTFSGQKQDFLYQNNYWSMKMFRKLSGALLLSCLILVSSAFNVFASNLDYATNNGPEYFRNPAGRMSAQDSADIAANNPAGTIRMGNGLFLNISNHTVIKKYTIKDESTGKKYASNEPDLFVPNMYVVWNPAGSKFNAWSHVGIIGGGGSLFFPDGAPVVNRVIAAGMAGMDAAIAKKYGYSSLVTTPFSGKNASSFNPATSPYATVDAYNINKNKYHFSVKQQSYQFCQTLGTTYSFADNLSVAIGGRVVESTKKNKIYHSEGVNSASNFIDVEMNAIGTQAILGVNYRPVPALNLALTYESVNKMKYKVKVKSNGTDAWGMLSESLTDALGMEDGKSFNYDMPHRFMAGATYNITSDFDVTLGGIFYINDGFGVTIETGTNDSHELKYLNKYAYEIGAGFDWKVTTQIVWSAGVMWDNTNQNADYMNEVNFHPSAFVVNTGFMFKVSEKLNVSFGFGRNFFPNASNDKSKAYNAEPGIAEPALTGDLGALNTAMGGSELSRDLTFSKETWITAVGAQYNFQ
jgi:long-subunit fatty acid transport protein